MDAKRVVLLSFQGSLDIVFAVKAVISEKGMFS